MGKKKSPGRKKSFANDKIPLENATGEDNDWEKRSQGRKGSSFYEDLDAFEEEEDRELVRKISKSRKHRIGEDVGEEVFGLSDSDSDIGFETIKNKIKKKKKKNDRVDDNSDLDEGDERFEDEFTGTEGWGKKKKHFYGGNPNERTNNALATTTTTTTKDLDEDGFEDEAEFEEQEGKKLQMKQLEMMSEEDFLGSFATSIQRGAKKKDAKIMNEASSFGEKIALDVSKMSRKEQIKLFQQDSPEFEGILNDFETKMKMVQEKLNPIVELLDVGKIPNGPLADYVRAKHQLCLNYCTNILCYLLFKSKRTFLKCHPLTESLVQYKKLLDQTSEMDKDIMEQIDQILENLENGEDIGELVKQEKKIKSKELKRKNKKRLKILQPRTKEVESDEDEEIQFNLSDMTADEIRALELYRAMKNKKQTNEEVSAESDNQVDDEPSLLNDENAPKTEEERRAITYKMEKNKGLTPKRAKLQRNPRVKHRHKFEKAKVRRKGQVREVRTEVKKYGGEFSGINARVKKGVKLA